MTTRTSLTIVSLFLGVSALLTHTVPLVAQERPTGNEVFKRFVGTWKGICADGAEFIVLKLSRDGNELAGTVTIANMNGGNGQCEAVNDPPTDEHAMKIRDVQIAGEDLAFKGSGQSSFEMSLVSHDEARLKFLGTPVEGNPWKLKRAK